MIHKYNVVKDYLFRVLQAQVRIENLAICIVFLNST